MGVKLKRLIVHALDIICVLIYLAIFVGFGSIALNSGNDWSEISLGEVFGEQFFSNNKIWFDIWIFSLVYLPIRAILGEKFVKMISEKKNS